MEMDPSSHSVALVPRGILMVDDEEPTREGENRLLGAASVG